jgi:hypothetical protein
MEAGGSAFCPRMKIKIFGVSRHFLYYKPVSLGFRGGKQLRRRLSPCGRPKRYDVLKFLGLYLRPLFLRLNIFFFFHSFTATSTCTNQKEITKFRTTEGRGMLPPEMLPGHPIANFDAAPTFVR